MRKHNRRLPNRSSGTTSSFSEAMEETKQHSGEPGQDEAAPGAADRQTAEIAHLRAEYEASATANAELRDAARAHDAEIGELRASNLSLETLVADLRHAQREVERLNRSLQGRNAALESINKELESFSYAVSHDLRSPLRSIHGFAEALRQSAAGKLTEEETGWLDRVTGAAARMDRLTEDLLQLSRLSRSQMTRQRLDLAEIARDVVRELRQGEPARTVACAIADDLWVYADPVLMRVVLANLLGNAWKYTARRDEALIRFGREQDKGRTAFCVRDNGAGFDMAYASKLFTPFQRLHSAREFPGSGVGLACVARVIHKHGGRLWAEAKVGGGAAFFFTVPAHPAADEEVE